MPLSRLENFLINTDGNILYVNPSDLDATDSFDNKGNSLTRPFVSIQRALLEAARFSYQGGANNDRYDKTTILLYPGTHYIDNRPGYSIVDSGGLKYYNVNGQQVASPGVELTSGSNFDLNSASNMLYKFNSVDGGVVVPKGTSIVGLDLRKTKVKPLYVPDPTDNNIPRSAIFRVTGGCYFWQFSIFDADKKVYYSKDFSQLASPTRSHHKLTCFEYCDGLNTKDLTGLTDLAMYYYKVMNAYGDDTGNREITNYPTASDFEPNNPEYRIVGPLVENNIVIDKITSSGTIATVDTETSHGLTVDDSVRITGVSSSLYNGSKVVTGITSATKFSYLLPSVPISVTEDPSNGKVIIEADNVTGSSPYIFNCSLRSVYGMCGLHADGSKATGFKSMVVAQFTGIGLQKDDNAFLIYNTTNGYYVDNNDPWPESTAQLPLYTNQEAVYNPSYGNYHIKASNDAFIQAVSTFAIGFANHFQSVDGSDQSITNSNSNFGSKSLVSVGFRKASFNRDNTGYITHIVPPKDLQEKTQNVVWKPLDAEKTVGIGSTAKLYLLGETDKSNPPSNIVNGYRVGSKTDENMFLTVNLDGTNVTYSSPIRMQISGNLDGPISEKRFDVDWVDYANDKLILRADHNFINGESIVLYSDNGLTPDPLENEAKYYIISTGLGSKEVKLAKSLNDAVASTPSPITITNAVGGILSLVSRVTDKLPGEIGHPIQWDDRDSVGETTAKNWYIVGSASTLSNTIYHGIVGYSTDIQKNNSSVYVQRKAENRDLNDRIYRLRYVIPKAFSDAKAPEKNYVLQESSTTGISPTEELEIANIKSNRNPRVISGITTANLVATVTTEEPHRLSLNDRVLISKVKSSLNTDGTDNVGYNGYYYVTSVQSTKTFQYNLTKGAGTFENKTDQNNRNAALPVFSRNEYDTSYTIHDVETVQEYVDGQQDGVYYLTCVIGNVSPTVSQFIDKKFKQNTSNLYPTVDVDNLNVDPLHAKSTASNKLIGKVIVNDTLNSITKEGVIEYLKDNRVGFAVTGAKTTGTASTVFTSDNHNLNSITSLNITVPGTAYGGGISTTVYNVPLINEAGGLTGENATVNLTVNSGVVGAVEIVDGGSAYGVGNTMRIDGGTSGVVQVASINNNVGDVVQVVGVGVTTNRNNSGYNGLYKITGVPGANSVTYDTGTNPGIYTTSQGLIYAVDDAISISTIDGIASNTTLAGIVTITTSSNHGLSVGNKIKITGVTGTASTIYNQDHIVVGVGSTTIFTINPLIGISTDTGSPELYKYGINAFGQDTSLQSEKISGSLLPLSANLKTELLTAETDTDTSLAVINAVGFSTGDFLQVDDEILRIKKIAGNTITVLGRGEMGSKPAAHDQGSVVRKINIIPSETRRFSSIRASGHTFEYLGYGPGNYSTALPQRHKRAITEEEETLAISTEEDGGVVFFSGMNDRGDFFSGERAQPSENFLGEDGSDLTATFDDVYIRNTLRVGGGPNRNLPSEFRGPVNFTNKITSTAADGILAIKLMLKGNPSQNPFFQVGNDVSPALIVNETTQNVGINTATPAYPLDVYGTIRADGYENFKLKDLPDATEEPGYARNRMIKVNDTGTAYEFVDIHELDSYKLRSYGISNDGSVYTGIGTDVSSKLQISGITTSKFFVGEKVKVFGVTAKADSTTIPNPSATLTRVPLTETDMGPKKYNYWISQYNFRNGKVGIGTWVNSGVGIAQTTIGNFNDSKHINLNITRADTSHGILVYRMEQDLASYVQPDSAANPNAKLVGILGPKDLGTETTITWKDYGVFEQPEWSPKGTVNEYDEDQIHFPNIATTGHARGWAIDSVVEVGTGFITLSAQYNTNSEAAIVGFGTTNAVRVVHDNTAGFATAITNTINSGGNYLELTAGTFLTNKLIIPSKFTIKGAGKNSIVKQQYFANDQYDGDGTSPDNEISFDGNFVGIGTTMGPNATSTPRDVTIQDVTFDGNSGNNILFSGVTDNYLLYMEKLQSSTIKGVEIRNSPGDGLYIRDSFRISIENSTFVDGAITDRYPFKPLVATGSTSLRVNDCLFENYPGNVDVSATNVVSAGSNIIRNCGSGLDAYATGKITTSSNIILGPSDEWLPAPDIYDSDWNSVNLNIPIANPQPAFTGPMLLYVEDGLPVNIADTKVTVTGGIGTMVGLYSTDSQPTLASKIVEFDFQPDNVMPDLMDREHGYIRVHLTADKIKDKLTIANAPTETGAGLTGITTAIGYEIIGTEFMDKPIGYSTYVGIGTGKWYTSVNTSIGGSSIVAGTGNTSYYVQFSDRNQYAGISTGDVVQLTNHQATPDIQDIKFTVAEKKETSGISTMRLEPIDGFTDPETAQWEKSNVVDGPEQGYISIRRSFIIAKGRVGVT